jgi:hypothetical protein
MATIKPDKGPANAETPVEIEVTGGLVLVEWVKFGDVETKEFKEVSPSKLKVTSPKGKKGSVQVSVKTYHDEVAVGTFTYE